MTGTEVLVEPVVSLPHEPEMQLLCFVPAQGRNVFLEGLRIEKERHLRER